MGLKVNIQLVISLSQTALPSRGWPKHPVPHYLQSVLTINTQKFETYPKYTFEPLPPSKKYAKFQTSRYAKDRTKTWLTSMLGVQFGFSIREVWGNSWMMGAGDSNEVILGKGEVGWRAPRKKDKRTLRACLYKSTDIRDNVKSYLNLEGRKWSVIWNYYIYCIRIRNYLN